jgi:hypothetical protein
LLDELLEPRIVPDDHHGVGALLYRSQQPLKGQFLIDRCSAQRA